MDYTVRAMRPEERPLLEEFLYQAIYVPEGETPPARAILQRPELRVYVDGFGDVPADHCVVAEASGAVVGAAWARIMDDYGHLDGQTPSLAIALLPEWRGRGIGTALLGALMNALAADGWRRASLSVQKANAAARLYRRLGFAVVQDREDEYLMARPLRR